MIRLRVGPPVVLVVAAAALAAAALAPAKEGARARLTTTLPLGAPPGKTIRVRWTVDVPDENGNRRPFGANGMFVRLLSRTGAPATMGFAPTGDHGDGRYAADVKVPAGRIGGVRAGLRGTTDIFFPLENNPFTSPGGVLCDVSALRSTLDAFVRAYNGGDLRRLDGIFSREHFVWYSNAGPGARQFPEARKRSSLGTHFRQRHRHGEQFRLRGFRLNGYEPQRVLGHFELLGERRSDDFGGGAWFRFSGKGALDCSKPPVTIAVMSVGNPQR